MYFVGRTILSDSTETRTGLSVLLADSAIKAESGGRAIRFARGERRRLTGLATSQLCRGLIQVIAHPLDDRLQSVFVFVAEGAGSRVEDGERVDHRPGGER